MANITRLSVSYYKEIQSELEAANGMLSGKEGVRSLEEAGKILDFLADIQLQLQNHFSENPSLIEIYDAKYGSFVDFSDREGILERCFVDEFLLSGNQLPSLKENLGSALKGYQVLLEGWIKQSKLDHEKTQKVLKEEFSYGLTEKNAPCGCKICKAEFRNRIREYALKELVEMIENTRDWMSEHMESESIDNISWKYYDLQKKVKGKLHSLKYRLRKASLVRLERQVKSLLNNYFSYPSDLAKNFALKLEDFFQSHLREEGLKRDFVEKESFERFLKQQGPALFRGEKSVKREYAKLVRSILRLKRKDISSGILQEYLGQFWMHADARKLNRKIVYHMGPTNSGKTYHAINALAKVETGCYLAPLRLLASELFDTLNDRGVRTTLLTGEEVIELEGAKHYSSTVEMAKLNEEFDCCVIDEIQMMNDPQRGWAWTRALVGVKAKEIHVCGDDSVFDLVSEIVKLTGDELEIKRYERMTHLKVMQMPIHISDLGLGDALIVFSRRNALKYKADLERLGFKVSIVYGRLSPEIRREQARKFDVGETDIIVSTDAIAMGMNLPIKRIVFSTLSKFIDSKEIHIGHSEVKQISGRAGRYNRFPVGLVTCLERVSNGIEEIQEALSTPLDQKNRSMVGPDLDIFDRVNNALRANYLPELHLSEFLRLFNTMTFVSPFYCVDLREMIELAEIVEHSNEKKKNLSSAEIFGFCCAPVNIGLADHVQYYIYILNQYISGLSIKYEEIDYKSDNIDYLETSIKCVELFQWLARHFQKKNFVYDEKHLLANKSLAIDNLNAMLSEHIVRRCSGCGKKLEEDSKYSICEICFSRRRQKRRKGPRRRKRSHDS